MFKTKSQTKRADRKTGKRPIELKDMLFYFIALGVVTLSLGIAVIGLGLGNFGTSLISLGSGIFLIGTVFLVFALD